MLSGSSESNASADRQAHLNPSSDGMLRNQLASGGGSGGGVRGGLNERLNTDYVDISPEDTSLPARITRAITVCVGKFCTPREILVVLRLLKAVTFCFLCLTIASDLMYIFFVGLVVSDDVNNQLGGLRDTIIRFYGLFLAIMAILIELDMGNFVKHFSGFKGFIPRSLLLFFIATITNAHPLHKKRTDNDDGQYNDDDVAISTPIPNSAIAFQMVTSFILFLCACVYFAMGLMCFDRFTSRAFLSNKDPLVSTAIPQGSGSPPRQTSIEGETAYEAP